MMNWRGYEELSFPNFRYCLDICLHGIRDTTRNTVKTVGIPAEIQSGKLLNTDGRLLLEPACSLTAVSFEVW
jgi:hypothetical protein